MNRYVILITIIICLLIVSVPLLKPLYPLAIMVILFAQSFNGGISFHKNKLAMISFLLFVVLYYRNIVILYKLISAARTCGNDSLLRTSVRTIFDDLFTVKHNFEELPDKPTIFVLNYPYCIYDYVAAAIIPKDIAYMMADSPLTRSTWSYVMADAVYRKKKGNSFEDVQNQIRQKLLEGKSILAYVTTKEFKGDNHLYIGRVRTGMMRIAKELDVTITPVVMDSIDTPWGIISRQNFRIHVGETFKVDDPVSAALRVRKVYTKYLPQFIKNKKSR